MLMQITPNTISVKKKKKKAQFVKTVAIDGKAIAVSGVGIWINRWLFMGRSC